MADTPLTPQPTGASATFTHDPSAPVAQETSPANVLAQEQPKNVENLQKEYANKVNTTWTKHMADKIRADLTSIPDANDMEALQVFHQLSVPDANPQEYTKILNTMYGKDYTPPDKPSGIREGFAHVLDFAQGLTNDVTALPKSLYEGLSTLGKGGVELAPTQPGSWMTLRGKTPEAKEALTQAAAHYKEGGVFAGGVDAMMLTEGLVAPIVGGTLMTGGVLPRAAGRAIVGGTGFQAFAGGSQASQKIAEHGDPAEVWNAFQDGFNGQNFKVGAAIGIASPLVKPAIEAAGGLLKKAWNAGKAAKEATTFTDAKTAASKAAAIFHPEWADPQATPEDAAKHFISELHGPDVVESDAGQRAIRTITKKITDYRKNLIEKSFSQEISTPQEMTSAPSPTGEISSGDTSDWERPDVSKKQVITPAGPMWNFVVDQGDNNLALHSMSAASIDEAKEKAMMEAAKSGGQLAGDVTPQYEARSTDRRVLTEGAPAGIERRISPRRTSGLSVSELQDIISKNTQEVDALNTDKSKVIRQKFAARNPGADATAPIKTLRTQLISQAQAAIDGAKSVIGEAPKGATKEEVSPEGIKTITKYARKPGESDAEFAARTQTAPPEPVAPRTYHSKVIYNAEDFPEGTPKPSDFNPQDFIPVQELGREEIDLSKWTTETEGGAPMEVLQKEINKIRGEGREALEERWKKQYPDRPIPEKASDMKHDLVSPLADKVTEMRIAKLGKADKPAMALQLKDGKIISDPNVLHHADLVDKYNINPDDVKTTGFMVKGKYSEPVKPAPEWAVEAAKKEGYDVRPGTPTGAKVSKEAQTKTNAPTLPRELAGAKPRYGYQDKLFNLEFESDIDKALFITSQAKKSAQDAAYREFLERNGYAPTEIDKLGRDVRDIIKDIAKNGDPSKGPISIPSYAENLPTPSRISRAAIREMIAPPSELAKRADKPSMASAKMGAVITEGGRTPAGATAYKSGPIYREPIGPTTRAQQTMTPDQANIIKKIENDPGYKLAISDLGGGRIVSHAETLTKAAQAGPMPVDELMNWKAGTAINEVDVVRANMTRMKLLDNFMQAMFEKDKETARQAWTDLFNVEAGYNNLTGTPGRATEIQRLFKWSEVVADKIKELQQMNAPFEQVSEELNKVLDQVKNQVLKGPKEKKTTMDFPLIRKIEDYATMAKLTSPVTHMIKLISETMAYLQRTTEKHITAAVLKISGQDGLADAVARNMWGITQGFTNAVRKAGEVAKYGDVLNSEFERRSSTLPTWMQMPGRALAITPAFWRSIIYDTEISTRAYIQAVEREGLTGDAVAPRLKQLMEAPPDSWKQAANETALTYTFQEQPDKLLKAIQVVQNVPGMRLIIPFTQTPYNIMRFYVRRSPLMLIPTHFLGIGKNSFYKDLAAGGLKQAEAISRLGLGLGMHAAAAIAIQNSQITGEWPKNPREAELWRLEGKQPWAIKIGNYWFNYNRIHPIGAFLSSVAAFQTAYEHGKFENSVNHLGRALGQVMAGALHVPFLEGLSSLFDFINDPERSAQKFAGQTLAGLIPNFFRDIRLQMDPTVRRQSTWTDAMKLMIPVPEVFKQVPPRISSLGTELKAQPPSESKPLPFVMRGLSAEATETDKTKLMSQIGWAPPIPKTKFTFQDNDAELQGDMKQQYLIDMGKAADKALTVLMADPNFQKAPDKEKKNVLIKRTTEFQEPVRRIYSVLSGVYGKEYTDKMTPEVKQKLEKVREILQP